MGLLENIGYAVDTPGALLRGVLAGKPGQRATGRDVLRLGPNKPGLDTGDVAGFLAEMVLDPVNLIGGAAAAKGAKLAANALRGRAISKGVSVARNVAPASKLGQIVAHSVPVESIVGAGEKMGTSTVSPMAKFTGPRVEQLFTSGVRTADPKSVAEMQGGMDWLAKHYTEKVTKNLKETGSLNVRNPHSQLQLWNDPVEGTVALDQMRNRTVPIKTGNDPYLGWYNSMDDSVNFNPAYTTNIDDLRSLGVHEGMHYLTHKPGLHRDLYDYLVRVGESSKKMWKRRGYDKPADISHYGSVQGQTMDDYIRRPEEIVSRVAAIREGMESAGLKRLTPSEYSKQRPYTRLRGDNIRVQSFPKSVEEFETLPSSAQKNLDEMLKVFGPRITNHLLKVLPAVPLAGVPVAAAMSQRKES